VVHLEIQPGKISAKVSVSELYTVEITIASLPEPHWSCVKGKCAGQIGSLVELMQGRLSRHVMDIVTQRGGGLFPKPAEIKMSCSCPDWADMCKHVAAVMYGVGARLDGQPELLFLLRKVDHLELIAGAVETDPTTSATKARGKKTIAAVDIADVFGIEMAPAETAAEPAPPVAKKPARAGMSATKTAAKKKPKRAVVKSKNSAALTATAAAKGKQPKTAKAPAKSATPATAKSSSRKRTLQTVS
jgi:uncharacterized Zn finger protein